MEDKATIVDSGNKWLVGAQIIINAPASEIGHFRNVIASAKPFPVEKEQEGSGVF